MPYMLERTCFHSDLTAKMYLNFDVLSNFSKNKIPGAQPHYIQHYFLLGSGEISRRTLKMSKTAEFRGTLTCLDFKNMQIIASLARVRLSRLKNLQFNGPVNFVIQLIS